MNTKIILLVAVVAASLVPAARAQHIDVGVDIRLGRAQPPPPPEVIIIDNSGPSGPPPWASTRSRWYQRSYGYYYYPGYDVYYRPDRQTWFYLEGRSWRSARQLPPHIHVDFGRSVSLTLATDRPYTYHDRVVAYYPPTYFNRVKFKHDRDNRHDDRRDNDRRERDDRGDRDRNDRGKGNDRDKRN